MALIWRNTFEGGTPGANITVANSGGVSGHAFDYIFYNNAAVPGGGDPAIAYTSSSPLESSVSGFISATATDQTYLSWRSYGDTSEIRYVARMKFVYTAVPSTARSILAFRYASTGVTIGTYLSTSAHIQLAGTGTPAGTTGAYTMIPGMTYIVQAYYTLESGAGGNGSVGWGLFDQNGVQLDSYSSPATVATGTTTIEGIRFMHPYVPEWSTGKIDDVAFGGLAAGWIGPPSTPVAPPAFSGYRFGGTVLDAPSVTINPNSGGSGSGGSACVVGDWMVLVFTGGAGVVDMNTPGDLAGWTVVRSYAAMTGTTTFQTGIWMKRRELGETSYVWPLDGAGYIPYWTLSWYRGAQDAYVGTFWDRNGNATNLTNIAPSVTTTVDNSLVVSISTERTVAAETDSQITVDNSMTKRLFNTMPVGTGDQNVSIADRTLAIASASGNTTWTYPNTQTSNGLAGHIWFTPSAGGGTGTGVPQIVGTPQTAILGTGFSLTLNVPPGYQVGDLLVAAMRGQASNSPTDWTNASFTRVSAAFVANSSPARVTGFFVHEVTGTEPSSYTFTIGASARMVGTMFIVRGASPTGISFYNSITGDSFTNGRTIPSYTANDPALVLEFGSGEFTAGNDHIPTNYPDNFSQVAEVVTNGTVAGTSRTYMWVGSRDLVGSTSTVGSPDADIAWAANPSSAILLSIAIAPTATPLPDFSAKLGDTGGILTDVYVRVGDTGNVLSRVSGMRAMLPRYLTVSEMLALPEFYMAHRGGSRDFPEMTLFAYGQSSLLSYGCLELSLARTSDGVWFGLHDQDINRTSGTTGLVAASTMTWATVQGYQVLGSMAANNPIQPDRPYARLQDILDAYPYHLFIVDVKYANTYREELLDILDSYGGNERFIGKSYGVGGTSFATSFANRGYQRWGYFYGSDIASLTTAYVNQWTLIGMDYNASLADWNTLASYRTNGQRMTGHICPDTTAVATARGKGATGFMVSGTVIVPPFAP